MPWRFLELPLLRLKGRWAPPGSYRSDTVADGSPPESATAVVSN